MRGYSINDKLNIWVTFLLLSALFSLGVAHINSIIYTTMYGGILLFYAKYYTSIRKNDFLEIRWILLLFALYLLIAVMSLSFSIDPKQTLKEIKSEILQNFIIFISLYLVGKHIEDRLINYLIYGVIAIFFIHSFLNIPIWVYYDFGPRMGGLLDTPGGEKYAVWLSVAFAFLVSLFLLKRYKYTVLLVPVLAFSMVINGTRAMYVSIFFVLLFSGLFIQNRQALMRFYLGLFASIFGILLFVYQYGSTISNRFDLKGKSEKIMQIISLSPAEMGIYAQNGELESEVARLSMWKSIYEAMKQDPITPRGFGRTLYSRTITKEFSDNPTLIPSKGALFQFPHNCFLGILYQLGIFGFATLFLLFFIISKKIVEGYKNTTTLSYKLFLSATFLAIIGFWGNMMFGSFFVDSEARMLYFLMGLALGITGRYRGIDHL